MIQIDFWGNGNNWSIEVVDYICDDDDEDNPGCWGNSGIIGALAPPRIWDYLPNLLSLQSRKTISGFGIWEYLANQGFGIICPYCLLFRVRKLFLYVGFAKDFGLFVQIETESENYFWIWDLGLFSQPRILNYLPNLLSLQHQSQKIIYVFFSSLNQPRLLLEMPRITPFDAMNITLWSSNSQMAKPKISSKLLNFIV